MATELILALLTAERDKLTQAIEALRGPTKRLGRPPKNPLAPAAAPAKKSGRSFTVEQRQAAGERMRQRWAVKKKAAAKKQPKSA